MSCFEGIPKALQRQALLFRKENNARVFLAKTLSSLANEIKRQRLENLCRIYPCSGVTLCFLKAMHHTEFNNISA